METKRCSKCGEIKPLSEFYRSTRGGCRRCVRKYQNKWYHEHKTLKRQPVPEGLRHCRRCSKTKPVEEFYRDKSNVSGYHHYCKRCSDELRKERRKGHKKPKEFEELPEGHKRCTRCKRVLPLTDFSLIWKDKERRKARCKECSYEDSLLRRASKGLPPPRPKKHHLTEEEEIQYRQAYNQRPEVKARQKERNQKYRQDPTHKRKARRVSREWRKTNPERCREQMRIKRLRKKRCGR
jgi:hypothetical protein